MKREMVIELWLAGFALVVGLIAVLVLLGTAAADGPPMSERAHLSFSHIHNLLPTDNVYAFGHLSVVGNIIKKKKVEVDPLCNEQDGCYPYGDGCEERDYYCTGNGTGCNYTSSNRHTDGWVDTGNTRWVDVNECQEKEQKEQEYWDYECSAGSCNYSITDTKWIDTGIYNSTCIGVSAAPLEITSFAPLSYFDDTAGNWRVFNVTVSQTANVSWYLNDMLVLTNESVREAKCTLHAEVVGEHNVTAIASNANGSDMQMWIWAVTSETPTIIGTGTKTITQTINVSNSFPLFSNAEYVHFTIGNDNITLTLDNNASFNGVCNLSDLMGRDVSVAGTTVELTYFPITYQGVSHDQKWVSTPFFDDVEHKLYLLAGSGEITTLNLEITELSPTAIQKVAGVGDFVGDFDIKTAAEGINSTGNHLFSAIAGVGFADLYVQYAPDTAYEHITFIPTFSQCEQLQLLTNSIGSFIVYEAHMLGVAEGSEPVPAVSPDWNLTLDLDLEYFPISYQGVVQNQKWAVYPSFDDVEHKLYLFSGSGIITASNLEMKENATDKAIPKVVGVGSTVGNFEIETVAEGSNSNYNRLESNMKGVGYANLYVQYAPDTSYESTPFLPTLSECEILQGIIDSSISGSKSAVAYQVDVLGVANGAEPIPIVSHDWNLSLDINVEYVPINFIPGYPSYDQKWEFYPFFEDAEHKLYLLSGSGIITASKLEMKENATDKAIPKVVGVGSTVGQFQIETVAESSNSNYNSLESDIKGIGYANIYAQYAPDTSYEDITFIPTFSQCERLQLNTHSNGSVVTCAAKMLGVWTGSECLMFNGIPLDMVAIDETFDLTYHPVIISEDKFDEKWSVKPEQYEDTLVILRGTGAMTALNFIYNDSTAAHPEISSYGYLRGDYTITANILPHYMAVVANGPDVAAMDESEQGGFGVNFSGEPSPCFIATAAYGTPLHDDINELRKFRDEYMMPNPAGQAMVKIYYTISPPVADLIRANEGLRTTVRDGLVKPLVEVTRLFVE
jgi:hypothetical protein